MRFQEIGMQSALKPELFSTDEKNPYLVSSDRLKPKHKVWANEIVQWVKVLPVRPDILSSSPRTCSRRREPMSFDSHMFAGMCAPHMHAYIQIK